jgi:hypothetical protein
MGGHPYWYFVDYNDDVNKALSDLREREYSAGRYNPAMPFIDFPLNADSPAPGPKHKSIEAAIKSSREDGTRSILDIEKIGTEPDYCVAVPLEQSILKSLYGTIQPTHDMVQNNLYFLEQVERGHCVYFIVYKDGKPSEILFAGYSFD